MYHRAIVVGKFAPLHCGHRFLLDRAANTARNVTVLVYATPDFVLMPNEMRAGWVRQLYPGMDVHIPASPPPDSADDLTHRRFVDGWLRANGVRVDVVLSGESYGPRFAAHIGAAHIALDRDEVGGSPSGTGIRGDWRAQADFLPDVVRASLAALPPGCDLNGRWAVE